MTELELNAPAGFEGRAVRTDDAGPWRILVSEEGRDLWLAIGETPAEDNRPANIDFAVLDGEHTSKLAALLGMPWEYVGGSLDQMVAWQRRCMASLSDNIVDQMVRASVEQLLEWRRDIECLDVGELLRASMTGDDPRAVSN